MVTERAKKIHETHEVRLICEYRLNGPNSQHREEYWCRLGKVDEEWQIRVQRRPPDGHRLRFGDRFAPDGLPRDSFFDLSASPKALPALNAWAAIHGYSVEPDKQKKRGVLLPTMITLSLRLPRELHDKLRQRVFERSAESINAEIAAILSGQKRAL